MTNTFAKYFRGAAAIFGILFASQFCTDAQTQADSAAAQTNSTPSPERQMLFQVVDADTGAPVADVKVRAWVGTNLVTDTGGACSIALPRTSSENFSYRLTLTKDGYVSKYITWSKARNDKPEEMPTNYTSKMEKAATIGGILKDQDGKPVAGARILFSGMDTSDPSDRERTTVGPNYHVERTDDNGHWVFNQAPRKFDGMTFRVVATDYQPQTFTCGTSEAGGADSGRVSTNALLAGDAAMVIGHGITLSGLVVDKAGKPVPGATITRNHQWRNSAAILQTDTNGSFKIPNLVPNDMILTVQAAGLEPRTVPVTVSAEMSDITISMPPGKILKGRVLDETGKPVAGASVQMDREDLQPLEFDWSTTTDSEGRFVWDSAPEGEHPYLFSAEGCNLREEPALVADGSEKTITLRKSNGKTVIDGKVTDVAEKTPVGKFTIFVRATGARGFTNFEQEVANPDGAYSVAVDQNTTTFTIEVHAPGYVPARSETRSAGDGDQRLDIAMEKGAAITGTVAWIDGTPVAGINVALCTETEGATIGSQHIQGVYQTNITATGADGGFAFPPMPGAHAIYAASERGFAEFDLTDPATPCRITLLPWGSIEGTAMIGSKPLAGAELALEGPIPNPVSAGLAISPLEYTVKTDAEGKFVFSNVPPVDLRLGQVVNNFFQNAQYVTVIPGRPTEARFGGSGREMAGKLGVAGYDHKINWKAGQSIVLSSAVAPPEMPEFNDPSQKKKWINDFWKSDAGLAWQRAQRAYTATADADGAFQIEDVAPGEYQLRVQLRESPDLGGGRLAALATNITVAEAAAGGDSRHDLGMVNVPAAMTLRIGDMAPAFETRTTDGRPLKLADYRGKFVLVDFWATWCGPCVAEMPNLKAVYAKYGRDDRFAMMSLSVDAQAAQPIEFARKNGINWIQGFLGEWNQSPVPASYGVDGIPAIFLIGPDGKIVGRDLRGEAIDEAIGRALGSAPHGI